MKRALSITVLLIGACILAYSVYMVSIGKSLTEPAGIVFMAIGLFLFVLGIYFNIRLSRPNKKKKKLACMLLGHSWKKEYRSMNDPLWHKTHSCSRCGITQEHSWVQIDNKCLEQCEKCGEQQSITHSFVEKLPCHFVCETCGCEEEHHKYIKKTKCEKVCSVCGKLEVTHQWNTVRKDKPSDTYWSMAQSQIFEDKLSPYAQGCTCENCGVSNPAGVHVCYGYWDGDVWIIKCRHCGTICKKETADEIDRRRYEQALNEDEGIFK